MSVSALFPLTLVEEQLEHLDREIALNSEAIVRQQRAVEILLQAVRRLDEKCAHILLMLEGRDA